MKTLYLSLVVFVGILAAGVLISGSGNSPQWSPITDAEAVIGMPLTPGSAAGVARRTTRRIY